MTRCLKCVHDATVWICLPCWASMATKTSNSTVMVVLSHGWLILRHLEAGYLILIYILFLYTICTPPPPSRHVRALLTTPHAGDQQTRQGSASATGTRKRRPNTLEPQPDDMCMCMSRSCGGRPARAGPRGGRGWVGPSTALPSPPSRPTPGRRPRAPAPRAPSPRAPASPRRRHPPPPPARPRPGGSAGVGSWTGTPGKKRVGYVLHGRG